MRWDVRLPPVGEGLTDAEIVKVLVEPGQSLNEDDEYIEVQGDKASFALPIPYPCVVLSIAVKAGDTVTTNDVLLIVDIDTDQPHVIKERIANLKAGLHWFSIKTVDSVCGRHDSP